MRKAPARSRGFSFAQVIIGRQQKVPLKTSAAPAGPEDRVQVARERKDHRERPLPAREAADLVAIGRWLSTLAMTIAPKTVAQKRYHPSFAHAAK